MTSVFNFFASLLIVTYPKWGEKSMLWDLKFLVVIVLCGLDLLKNIFYCLKWVSKVMFFWENFAKGKTSSGHGQFGFVRDAPILATRVQLPSIVEKSVFFFSKNVFFHKTQLWLPCGRRPLRDPLLWALSMRIVFGNFIFCKSHTCELYKNKICKIAQEGPLNEFFCTFSGRFFGRACLRPRYVKSLRSGFFCNVKKCVQKIL